MRTYQPGLMVRGFIGWEKVVFVGDAEDEKYAANDGADGKTDEQDAAINDEKPKEPRGAIPAAEKGDANQNESDDAESESDRCSDEHLADVGAEPLRVAVAG